MRAVRNLISASRISLCNFVGFALIFQNYPFGIVLPILFSFLILNSSLIFYFMISKFRGYLCLY